MFLVFWVLEDITDPVLPIQVITENGLSRQSYASHINNENYVAKCPLY